MYTLVGKRVSIAACNGLLSHTKMEIISVRASPSWVQTELDLVSRFVVHSFATFCPVENAVSIQIQAA